ncbi:hypothetical protein Acr_00g0104560 [Actinidia rufa]|uniref:Uncharacterized protein n=1 Tax=Actinidia rufa TaxID=165716 RepID=A0A7J0D8L6_9ERIC|nr:hypothetical protein Acr_00g0000060 [Actinidia rufa]GFS28722.1 hypothetical protein Acr_00g0003530 [Actinidia rufa]GFS28725.1 hypothetical protein Acr_00g0003560 [Actinidia rufa]GFS28738.1 hypothetical protein Acr_00g0003620 [Actinidia rufa]GFS46893.1 hypothetical protein Acr_00g0104560 [Actinidia rufa]
MWHEPSTVAQGQEMKRQSVENPSQMRRVPEYTDEASDEELAATPFWLAIPGIEYCDTRGSSRALDDRGGNGGEGAQQLSS